MLREARAVSPKRFLSGFCCLLVFLTGTLTAQSSDEADATTPPARETTTDQRAPALGVPEETSQRTELNLLGQVDASSGDVVWKQRIGITEGLPAEKQNTGRPGRAAAIVTASGLLFVASTDDSRLRALDVKTGEQLWVSRLQRRGNANPMTYMGANGKQYVVIAATDTVVAYQLP